MIYHNIAMKKIFIVDSYNINLFVLNEYLKESYDVETFSESYECISRMHECLPEVIIVNCGVDYSVAEDIKKEFPDVRIIGTSASRYNEECPVIDQIIIKPIYKPVLMKCLSAMT
jgi:PleD family two-component response regulator